MTATIKVLVVDDDPLVRLGLLDLLGTDPAFDVVAEAGDGGQAVEAVRRRRFDVVLMDLRMPHLDGISAIQQISTFPDPPRMIALTTFDADESIFGALEAGAVGFLLKDTSPADILRSIHVVAGGGAMLHPTAARQVVTQLQRRGATRCVEARRKVGTLTPREHDVLTHLAHGRSNAEIGQALKMRESTVKAHVTRIMERLGVANRVQAAIIAHDAGDLPRPRRD